MTAPGPRTPDLVSVQEAYRRWSTQYVELFGTADRAAPEDRVAITAWAETVAGPVLDAGCGPGHWTAFLTSLGLEVEGVDATDAFVQHARRTHPALAFRLGDLRALDVEPGSLGGVLAWFSLIHLDPVEVPQVLHELRTALRPDGSILLGFFGGPELTSFDHRVVTAWAWPMRRMEQTLEAAGFEVLSRGERPQAGGRVFAEAVARRSSAAAG